MRTKHYILFILLFSSVTMLAQKTTPMGAGDADVVLGYVRRMLPNQSQLPTPSILEILQDADGMMWYRTETEICRDNGFQIDVFAQDSLQRDSRWVVNGTTCMVENRSRHEIWIGTATGLYALNSYRFSLRRITLPQLEERSVQAMLQVSDGSMWIAACEQILHLSADGTLLQAYQAQCSGDGAKWTNAFYEDSRRNLWLLECRGGIRRFDETANRFVSHHWPEEAEPKQMVEDVQNGCYWVSTSSHGIYRFRPNPVGTDAEVAFQHATFDAIHPEANSNRVQSILLDQQTGLLWSVTMSGLHAYRTQGGGLTAADISHLLPQGKCLLNSLSIDRNGRLWVASTSPTSFILMPPPQGLHRAQLTPLQQRTNLTLMPEYLMANHGDLWICHRRVGLVLWQPQSDFVTLASDHVGYFSTAVIAPTSRQRGLWVAAADTLCMLDPTTEPWGLRRMTACGAPLRTIHDDEQGNVYLGTTDDIFCFHQPTGRLRKVFSHVGHLKRIATSSDGRDFFFLTMTGELWRGDVKNGKTRLISNNDHILCLWVTPEGKVWTGSSTGSVHVFDPSTDKLTFVPEASTPAQDPVTRISSDHLGHIWIQSSRQVREYNPRQHNSRVYRSDDPLINLDRITSLVAYHPDTVCFAGFGGLFFAQPTQSLDQPADSRRETMPFVADMMVDGVTTRFGRPDDGKPPELTLKSTGAVVLHLSTGEVADAANIQFAYRMLSDSDTTWTLLPSGQNELHLTDLSGGKVHTLQVRACDATGRWSVAVDVCTLIVPSTFGRGWKWALSLLIVSILFGLILLWKRLWHTQNKAVSQSVSKENIVARQPESPASVTPGPITVADKEFLERAEACVSAHLSDSQYSIQQFSRDMCMGRMNLYRRLMALTGLSPTDYLRQQRLRHAAQMLRTTSLLVSQVAEACGFTSLSYFSRSFKEEYGVQPKQYQMGRNDAK